MPNIQAVAEIARILASGNFEQLVGTAESLCVEAKGEPYKLSTGDWYKHELAKDVSALANASGGIILVGFRTKKNISNSVEEIESCRPFDAAMFDAEQCRNVLQHWIHPPIHSVSIDYHPSLADPTKGVAAIIIPAAASADKPYVVVRAVAPDGKMFGTLLGYFERVLDRIPTTSVATLRSQLKDGMRFAEFSERLANIEAMLAERFAYTPQTASPTDRAEERLAEAEKAVGRLGLPNFVLLAESMSECRFPQLFESRTAPVVALLEQPPVLRRDGFAIRPARQSLIIKGQLRRRVIEGYEMIDLWRDGTLIAIGPGDYDLLCWARQPRPGVGLPIRNFVLAEVTLNFLMLASGAFTQAAPLPKDLRFSIRLENMTVDGLPCTLSSERDNIRFPRAGEKRVAPDSSTITAELVEPFKTMDVGRVAYELIAQIYAFFGFNHHDMPYVDENDPNRITPKSMFIDIDK